jgi:uncharacterized protein YegP (UPF0339 family)
MEQTADGRLVNWYRNRIGDPSTADEALGYWLFALGAVLAILGVVIFLASGPANAVRQWAYVLAAAGLALVFAGPIVRLPLRRRATWFVNLGLGATAVALVWFVIVYPENWGQYAGHTGVIAMYAAGLGIMALGGIVVPILTDRADLEAEAATLAGQVSELESVVADATADEADLAAALKTIDTSQSRFELYEDRGGEWRWRLRHRNGNLIASSGEGYTRLHNAQGGMEAVRRDAYGAPVLLYETEAELPESEATFEPVAERESKGTFECYEDAEGGFRWRLRHDNGNLIASAGEGYASKRNVRNAVDRIKALAGPADFLWPDPTAFEVYRDQAGEWRWRLLHRNGEVLADGGEGYAKRGNARRAIDTIREHVGDMEFETYTDAADEHRFRLLARNGEILGDSGEGYASADSLDEAIERIREYVPEADLLEIGQAAFELYEDAGGEFRWRLRHRNGNLIAGSGEGYVDRSNARDGIQSVKLNAPNADVEWE